MRPLICETATGQSMAELIAARDASRDADLVELRLDGISDLDVAGALAGRRGPVVVTCRAAWEGGHFDGSEDERRGVLERALTLGADFVDVEWRAGFDDLVRSHAARVVLSSHDFTNVPRDLCDRARVMRATGAALIKVAVMPARLSELSVLKDVASQGPTVVIGMGDRGVASRLLAAHFGSRWSYAGQGAAPGQLPASRMVQTFRFREVHAGTAVYGVVGNNVIHSLSPVMHNAAFDAAGVDAVYVPLLPADFADFLAFADAFDVQGASVTIPYKLDALAAARDTDVRTRRIGAANTLKRVGAAFEASNSDVDGFLAPLVAAYPGPLEGTRASLLGAGGAARAAAVGLVESGARLTIHARREAQARELAAAVGGEVGPWPVDPDTWDLLVNSTPAGSSAAPDESPLPGGPFDGALVYDLTYRAPGMGGSRLVREARAAGCAALDGLPMLVAQAEQQFEWWTGRTAPAGVMAAALGRRQDEAPERGRDRG